MYVSAARSSIIYNDYIIIVYRYPYNMYAEIFQKTNRISVTSSRYLLYTREPVEPVNQQILITILY